VKIWVLAVGVLKKKRKGTCGEGRKGALLGGVKCVEKRERGIWKVVVNKGRKKKPFFRNEGGRRPTWW